MQYHAVVDRFPVPVPLDPIAAAIFTAVFLLTLLAAHRRPALGIAALAASAPFAYYHQFIGEITFPKVILVAVICALALQPQTFAALREKNARRVLLAAASIIGAILISGVHAAYREPMIREALKWLEYLAAIGTIVAAYRRDPDNTLILRAWIISIAAVCASALAQEIIGAPSGLLIGPGVVPRIAGVLEGPNQLGGYLETAIAILTAWTIARPSRAIGFVLAAAVVTLALTFSRGAMIGSAVAIGTLAIIYRREAIAAAAPLLAGAAIGFAADAGWSVAAKSIAALRVPSIGPDYAGGVGNRSELWRAAVYFFRTHPLFGIGAGNYELDLPQAGLPNVRTHANSWYLQQLAEGGLVLFAATIAFIGSVVTTLVRNVRSSPWAAAALASTAALCVHQLADYIVFYPKAGLPWMIAIALGVAASLPNSCAE